MNGIMQNKNSFFTLKPTDLYSMIERRSFNKKVVSTDDLAYHLYRNTETGALEIRNEEILTRICRDELNIEDDCSTNEKYRSYSAHYYGYNQIFTKRKLSFWDILWSNMTDSTLILLFIAAIVSLFSGFYKMYSQGEAYAWIEGTTILLAILVIITIGTVNEYSQEALFHKLDIKKNTYDVKTYDNYVYDTREVQDIVVGDIVYLETGDVIPADCVMITDGCVKCDESMLTGESEPVIKSKNEDPFLVSGTYLIEGSVKAIVICVGINSVKGRIIAQMHVTKPKTPLEKNLIKLSSDMARYSGYVAIALFLAHLAKSFTTSERYDFNKILDIIVESISIIVMAIPEGLPMAITLALSFGTKRMIKDNSLVRDVSACETMNNANYICTDKTGTLTQNKMMVRSIFYKNRVYGELELPEMEIGSLMDYTFQNIILNSSAFENKEGVFIGSNSEIGLLRLIKRIGIDYELFRRGNKIVARKDFSSETKYMSTVIKKDNKYIVFFKGAPEIIAEYSDINTDDNNENTYDNDNTTDLFSYMRSCDNLYYRTIAFSFYECDSFDPKMSEINFKRGTFLAAIAMEDPLRPGITDEVTACKNAGINLVMLTGDNKDMADFLARKLGLMTHSYLCLSGNEFNSMSDDEVFNIIHRIRVIARASPSDKRRFVDLLQQKGNVVAVTGDGSNDGPALKKADVGFGMGLSGTDIAKEASSIILMDDDFASLVKTISWGRCINDSVRRFIQFQITVTITTIIIAFIGSLFISSHYFAFSPIKLLWINILMDTFAALALSTDSPNRALLDRSPEPKNSPIITHHMKMFILLCCIYQLFIILGLYVFYAGETFIFNTFVFMQLFNAINARSLSPFQSPWQGILRNFIFLGTNFGMALAQVIVAYWGGVIFKTTKMQWSEIGISILLASTIIPYFWGVCKLLRSKSEGALADWNSSLRHIKTEVDLIDSLCRV
ncbi:Calcium-transporting ATPase 2 [Astathelohania contejeani]|uniref:Calcium-transporting ATPase n=1 Tax=Astathelohania contejeani TaxID=164912 RepID=A0ABQ7I1W0_9MICR|nr:Calcium-transporting ATPase 2 [Thelohania contejeani]